MSLSEGQKVNFFVMGAGITLLICLMLGTMVMLLGQGRREDVRLTQVAGCEMAGQAASKHCVILEPGECYLKSPDTVICATFPKDVRK